MTYLVAVYDESMCCGGGEEGGWWYDHGQLIRILKCFKNEDSANAYCRRLNESFGGKVIGPDVGKRDYSSVLSEGRTVATVCENTVPELYPESRPHYE
jgi:hypothetical protein